MIKLKLTILFMIFIIVSGCTEFAMLMSGSSIAISQNAYVRAYNGVDVLTIMSTEKSIKKHIYDKGKEHVQPLPESLTIKKSKVNGLGLFAREGIAQGANLGMSHVLVGSGIIRTPMGGFINHSDDANTVKVELKINNEDDPLLKIATKKWNLVAVRNIKEGEELTVRYTFYDVG